MSAVAKPGHRSVALPCQAVPGRVEVDRKSAVRDVWNVQKVRDRAGLARHRNRQSLQDSQAGRSIDRVSRLSDTLE